MCYKKHNVFKIAIQSPAHDMNKKKRFEKNSKKNVHDVKKKTMTLRETEDWIDEAVNHDDEMGRCRRAAFHLRASATG
jgi:hypothetical protein